MTLAFCHRNKLLQPSSSLVEINDPDAVSRCETRHMSSLGPASQDYVVHTDHRRGNSLLADVVSDGSELILFELFWRVRVEMLQKWLKIKQFYAQYRFFASLTGSDIIIIKKRGKVPELLRCVHFLTCSFLIRLVFCMISFRQLFILIRCDRAPPRRGFARSSCN
jgi:hypothetical protein